MRLLYQIIENSLTTSSPTILLTTDNCKYFFNVSGGVQRFAKQHRFKLNGQMSFFFTKGASSALSGLPGLLLSLYDSRVQDLQLYLSPRMFEYLEHLRYIIGSKTLLYSYCDWDGRRRIGYNDVAYITSLAQGPPK